MNISINSKKEKEKMLIKISLVLSISFIYIIIIFGFIYLLISLIEIHPYSENYLINEQTGDAVDWYQVEIFLYFSAVTYFSLGYGDIVPVGSLMYAIIVFESLLGYINSGLIIAYGFDIFRKIQS